MGAVYAIEQRRVPGHELPVTCVLLDSVQSQANRMEQALQEALDAGELALPIVEVDFSEAALPEPVGRVTGLQAPHRLADAILRDSEHGGKPFRESEIAKVLNRATPLNATPVYRLCPSALVFGMWDSSGPKGGLGAKFERAMVSEVVGIGAEFGVRTASRIDPIITKMKGIVLYRSRTVDGLWTSRRRRLKDGNSVKPAKLGKEGKVSEANLGNVTPGFAKYAKGAEGYDPIRSGSLEIDYSIRAGQEGFAIRNRSLAENQAAREGQIAPGGVTVKYAEQVTTLSLICLRRLRSPVNGSKGGGAADAAGRTVLAALGLCAATLAFEAGVGLRSRCLLWPESPMQWELLAAPGKPPESFTLDSAAARKLLADAVSAAEKRTWSGRRNASR